MGFPGSETVLLVEDEEAVRKLVSATLQKNGYTVLEARDGPGALQIAQRYKGAIHLLLTDVVMPTISGLALAQCLTPLRPEMKVLYISGYAEDDIVRHAVADQGPAFLQKPFSVQALLRKVRELLDAAKKHVEHPESS